MKITFISTSPIYWGGSEVLWVRCAQSAIAQGHQVQLVIFSQKDGYHPAIEDLRKSVASFVEIPNSFNYKGIAKFSFSVKSRLFPFKYDEIVKFNAETIFVNQPDTYLAAFNPIIEKLLLQTQKPFFLLSQFNAEHEALNYADINKARNVFAKARAIYFVSQRNLDVAEHQLASKISNAALIGNHPDIKAFNLIPYPKNQDVVNFASVARLETTFKGQDLLLQIFSKPKWRSRSWHLNFYGTGPDDAYLKELAAFYQLSEKVTFHGHVNNIEDVWGKNHALLMPSTAEGKPLALAEAMACGRIAIVSDVAGNAELVEDEINGFLASSYFPEPFDESIERAWKKIDSWEDMGVKARQKVIDTIDPCPQQTLLNYITGI